LLHPEIAAMPRNPDSHSLDDLFREVDAHLREAERLRNFVEHQQSFWPDRRRQSRVPSRPTDSPKDNDDT
jgi:hypothetical protein